MTCRERDSNFAACGRMPWGFNEFGDDWKGF